MVRQAKIHYPTKSENHVCIVQITDTHLFGEPTGELLGVNTNDSLNAVVALIAKNSHQTDALLATGDISQDYTPQSYQNFIQSISGLQAPCHFSPGNHDEWQMMQTQLAASAPMASENQIIFDNWQILLLNSTIPKKPSGYIEDSEFAFIERAIHQHPEKHVLIAMHHNPVKVDCKWLDQHWLQNGDEFLQRVSQYSQVKGLLWGHIHQEFDRTFEGQHHPIRMLASPSTCIQFTPRSNHFALDGLQPGYRLLELKADGSIYSTVYRVQGDRFSPENEVSGY
ncbi:3',5'-cyclic-AMP phosphodiesterase [Shewanella sp. 202IG2-18]|nr:3',5'-cyclic-AMP phosphodiesterase [Parashewanella hymeniacidonis]